MISLKRNSKLELVAKGVRKTVINIYPNQNDEFKISR